MGDTQKLAKAIYFTAAPVGEEKSSRQSAFLNANKILNPDLIPPLEAIRELFPQKKLKVYFPPAHFSRDIKDCIWRWKKKPVSLEKNERRFKDALMSDLVCQKYSIPEKWKQQMK